jgi:O-antigen/teichoic acid export membrane protein
MQQRIPPWLDKPVQQLLANARFRRVVKNTGYLFSTTGISAGLSMLQSILAARLLGVDGFGILATISMFTSVINNFASFKMNEVVVRYVGEYSENHENEKAAALFKLAAFTEMGASIVAFILVCLLAPIGATYFAKDPSTTPLFIVYGTILLANLIAETSTGLLQIYDRFREIAVYNLVQNIITLVLTAIIFVAHGNMLGVLLAILLGKVVSALGITIAALVEASRHWGSRWWHSPIKQLQPRFRELTRFAINTNISGSLSLITKDSEVLWVSFFRSPVEAGYYKLALSLAYMVQMPVSPMPQTTYPELSRQAIGKDWKGFRHLLRQGSILAGGYTLIATLGFVVLGIPLIRFLYTPEFLPAYPALVIVLVGYLFADTFYWRRVALLALGEPSYPTKLNSILAALKLLGIILFVPAYGYLASAALLSWFYITGSVISAFKVNSLLSQRERLSESLA